MMNNVVKLVDRFWLYAILLPCTINSGDAVGRYTAGIKLSLLSAKYCSTFLDL